MRVCSTSYLSLSLIRSYFLSELNLSVAAHISDRITDQVIESLSTSYKTLIGECEIRTRSSTPDVLRPSAGSTSSGGGSVLGVTAGGMSLSLSTGTPVIERTSLIMDEEDDKAESESIGDDVGQDNDNHTLLGKAMGRLSEENDSPMVSENCRCVAFSEGLWIVRACICGGGECFYVCSTDFSLIEIHS